MSLPQDGTRPAINYKLKDNPFFAANKTTSTDAKPPPGAAPPKRTVKQWQPQQNDKKTVRTSVQKMAASSTVSSNPWKTAAQMANNATRKSSSDKKPTEQSKSSVLKREERKTDTAHAKAEIKSISQKSSSSNLSRKDNEVTKAIVSKESSSKEAFETPAPAPAPAPTPDSVSTTTTIKQKEHEKKTVEAAAVSAERETKVTDTTQEETKKMPVPTNVKPETKTQTEPELKHAQKPELKSISAIPDKESLNKETVKRLEDAQEQTKNDHKKHDKIANLEPIEKPDSTLDASLSPPAPQSVAMVRDSVPVSTSPELASLGRGVPDNLPGSPKPTTLTAFGMSLPWSQFYSQPDENPVDPKCIADSQDMLKQLDISYAVLAALDFPTMPTNDAEKWREKYNRARTMLLDIQKRIEVEQDLQQSIMSLLKIEYDRSLISEIQTRASNMCDLIQELFATVLHAQDSQSKYLKHLAGTLAAAVQSGTTNGMRANVAIQPKLSLEPIVARVDAIVKSINPARTASGNVSDDESLSDESVLFPKSVRTSVTSFDNSSFTFLPSHESTTSHLYAALETIERHLSTQRRADDTLPMSAQQQQPQSDVHVWLSKILRRSIPSEAAAESVLQEMIDRNNRLESQLQSMDTRADEMRKNEKAREAELFQRIKDLEQQLQVKDSKLAAMQQEIQRLSSDNTVQQLVERNNQLEQQLQSYESRIAQLESATSKDNDSEKIRAAFQVAQEEYTRREAAWMLQSASVEAELGAILKEYDRLTRNITDFNNERKRYETQISTLSKERQLLEKQLADYRIRADIGKDGQTMTLRKEFRQLMATVKSEHQQELDKEVERRRELEQELRDLKHELEMKRWDMNHAAVQTHFIAYPPTT